MKITIDPTQKGHDLGNLFGLFFEDLNHAADGGLYAELVQNRDFEFDPVDHADYTPLTAWNPVGNASIKVFDSGSPFPNTPRYGAVSGLAGEGMENLGYGDGIPVKEGIPIRLTLWSKSDSCCSLSVSLAGDSVRFKLSASWDKYEALLTPTRTGHTERVTLTLGEDGAFDLAFLSLMPTDGWPGQANMLRRDIAQALADMKPHFLRFPGGCLTHDGVLDPDARDGIYNWKKTIGPVENRPPRRNNWKYHQTLGLGFYEYFLFCEDIGAEPLPVVCGGLDPHHLRFAEGEVLERYIQDAADLVEFANGSADTHWGSVRASLGHPAPFHLRYLAVGNEEIHEIFFQNMARFRDAIHAVDPAIEVIGSASPVVQGLPYNLGWQYAKEQNLAYVDEHYYQAPEWFLANAEHYANYSTQGPRVFLGEYASWGNTMENALAEAAYMVGLQNAPGVALACYAPMLSHLQYTNWKPDMLWFDNHRILKTPNYHTQSMFMRHQGDHALLVTATENEPGPILSRPMGGRIFIRADETAVRLSSLRLITPDVTLSYPDCTLSESGELPLHQLDGDFRLEFILERISGNKGILVRFGQLDEENYYQWTVGGWQNSDSGIDTRIRGRGSCLTQSNLYIRDSHAYHMTLEVSGSRITTIVDGEILNQVDELPLRLRPLYLAASSEEETGDIILKAVNVQDHPVTSELAVPCRSYTTETLSGSPEEANTMDEPDRIQPKLKEIAAPCKAYTFPAHSVTVIRFHQS